MDALVEHGDVQAGHIVDVHTGHVLAAVARIAEGAAVALSLSRVSRLVDGMQAQGLVTKERDTVDTRGSIARLTPAGLDQLRAAYPVHLASVRQRVIDHVAPELVRPAARALAAVAASMR